MIGAVVARAGCAAAGGVLVVVVGRTGRIVVVAARVRRGVGNVVRRQFAALARLLGARVWRENSFWLWVNADGTRRAG